MARSNVPRYLILQDPQIGPKSVIRVRDTADPATGFQPAQRGVAVSQPEPEADAGNGNLRPTLSGIPEQESGGSLRIVQPGVEGTMRWGHRLAGASSGTDLQLRQKPLVVHKRADVIYRATGGSRGRPSRPKLLPLRDGTLLMLWLETGVTIYDAVHGTGWDSIFLRSTYTPSTDLWTAPANISPVGSFELFRPGATGPWWIGIDMIQMPDTDEIIAVIAGTIDNNPTFGQVVLTYSSNDGGVSWAERARNFENGNDPDLVWDVTDVSGVRGIALERTEGGRLVAVMATEKALHFLMSDDRGETWATGDLPSGDLGTSHGTSIQSIQCSITRLRNDVILAAFAICEGGDLAGADTETHDHRFYLTTDGINWSAPFKTSFAAPVWGAAEMAVCETPDGWPWVFACVHELTSPGATFFDEIAQAPFFLRDPLLSDATQPILFPTSSPTHLQHGHLLVDAGRDEANKNNAPAGLLDAGAGNVTFDGFYGMDVVRYRDGLWMVVGVENEPDQISSLMVYRLNGWQPIQERIPPEIVDTFTAPINTRPLMAGYNITWDCYDLPGNWGFVTTLGPGGAAHSIVPVTNGGYYSTAVAGGVLTNVDTTLPYPLAGRNGMLRVVFRVVSGGSLTAEYLAIKFALEHISAGSGINLLFLSLAPDVLMDVIDAVSGLVLASVTITNGMLNGLAWIELLVAMKQDNITGATGQVYHRVFQSLNGQDRDHLVGYDKAFEGALATGGIAEVVEFGHFVSNTSEAHWKSIHLSRHSDDSIPEDYLARHGDNYSDSDKDNYRHDRGEPFRLQDPGVYNHMRGAQAVAIPEQMVEHGLFASWRGEANVPGGYEYATRYLFGAQNLFDLSTNQREWRSLASATEVEIVLDAEAEGGVNAVFRPGSIAVFGRNWPVLRLQLNATDSWGAPSIDFRLGVPGIGGAPAFTRYTHLYNLTVDGTHSITVGHYRAQILTPQSGLWRPHRWRSRPGGPKYYAVFPDEPAAGTHIVYEIVDNTEDGLHLVDNPIAAGVVAPVNMVIISDRFAYDFEHLITGGFATGWRFMRLLIEKSSNQGPDNFQRIGRIVIGQKTLIDPGIAWGQTDSWAPGSNLITAETGARYSRRNHPPRKIWTFDSPFLRAPSRADAVSNSPERERASWAKLVDLMRRLEANGEPAALVFDGLRFEGLPGEALVQVAADPYDLAVVRATSQGETAMGGYMGRTMNLADGTDCAPQEVRAVRRIVLEEDL